MKSCYPLWNPNRVHLWEDLVRQSCEWAICYMPGCTHCGPVSLLCLRPVTRCWDCQNTIILFSCYSLACQFFGNADHPNWWQLEQHQLYLQPSEITILYNTSLKLVYSLGCNSEFGNSGFIQRNQEGKQLWQNLTVALRNTTIFDAY